MAQMTQDEKNGLRALTEKQKRAELTRIEARTLQRLQFKLALEAERARAREAAFPTQSLAFA